MKLTNSLFRVHALLIVGLCLTLGCENKPTDTNGVEHRLIWRTRIPDPIYYSSPCIGPDGTIYIGSRGDTLRAFAPNGNIKWSFYVRYQPDFTTSPVIDDDGTIFFSSTYLFALNPDGSVKWQYYLEETRGSPAVGSDGTVYVTSFQQLCSFTPDGTLNWATTIFPISSPVIGQDGTIYLGSWDLVQNSLSLAAINPDGTVNWRLSTPDFVNPPAIDDDGSLYFVSEDTLYSISNLGVQEWMFPFPVPIERRVTPAIGFNGTIYIGTSGVDDTGYLYAISNQGELLWTFSTPGKVTTTPTIGVDGTLYFGCHDGYLYAVDDSGSLMWKYDSGSWIGSSPAIANDGTIYFGTSKYFLYALKTESLGLADTPWPKFRGNNQNTGRH